MAAANPPTAFFVLALGNLLGGISKGGTGFGSGILNLCTWVVFKVAGLQSGSLQQAVVCEALASTVIAPGLLYVTRAHATADLKMVATISLFVALSSPLGAAILAKLDSRRVELVMGAALLLIILGEQASKLVGRCRQSLHRQQQQQQTVHGTHSVSGTAGSSGSRSLRADSHEAAAAAGVTDELAAAAADCTVDLPDGPDLTSSSSRAAAKQSDRSEPYWDAAATQHPRDQGSYESLEVEQQQTLLGGSDNSSSSSSSSSDSRHRLAVGPGRPSTVGISSSSSSGCQDGQSGRAVTSWRAVLAIGSVCGSLSGIMEGLTGMNGPPIILMYRALNTDKVTVRGNNAFLNLLQMRLVPYWYMGLITKRDVPLYGVCCAAACCGVLLGDRLSHHIPQQSFQQLLGLLMVLCCALMFASGLGLMQ